MVMTKEQLDTAMAILDAHSEERRRQHDEITAKLDIVIKNTKHDLYLWIIMISVIVVSMFSVISLETLLSLIH
jgi:hypothetical protein